jgi:hypothetical protein
VALSSAGISAQVRDLKVEKSPVASAVAHLPPISKRWALIVGVDTYEDKQISPLYAASNDANALAEAFTKYAGFPKDQVIVLASNQPAERQPTRGNVLLRLANLSRIVPKDGLLLFAFAGHGIERDNHAFLLPSDAKMSDHIRVLQSTALSVTEIRDWIQETSVKQVIILLDACRNDPTAGRGEAPNRMTETYRRGFDFDSRNSQVEAFATLYATRIGQRAYEYAEKKHGYFTWAIVEALKGGAANARGEITLGSLETFIQNAVPRQIAVDLGQGKDQRPFADVRGYKAAELILAKIDPKNHSDAEPVSSAPDPRVLQLEEWQRLRSSRDIRLLTEYQANSPNSPFAEEAARRIELLEWEAAKETNTIDSYRGFVEKHPNGLFTEQARTAIQQLDQTENAAKMIAQALRNYEEAYRNRDNRRVAAVWPSLGKRELGRIEDFFRMAKSVELRLEAPEPPQIDNDTAVIRCRRTMRFTDERGQQKPLEDTVTIRMRKSGDQWVFEAIQ